MYSITSLNASASSGGMTKSRASPPITSSREKPVTRSHASLKKRMRASCSRTQTSDIVVSVRTLANSSPRMKSGVSDIEEPHRVVLDRAPGRPHRFSRELTEVDPRQGAGSQRRLVGPQRNNKGFRLGGIPESDQSAKAGAVPE